MGTWPLWIAFNAGVAFFLALDLGLIHRNARAIGLREAAFESAAWIALSLGFGAWIFYSQGRGPGLEFFAGYIVEKSMSLDNVFVFLLVFQYFRIEPLYQHRLLFWGVLGALVLRGAMIGAGAALIARFSWTPYLLGAFLLYSGFQLFGADHAVHPEKNPVVRWAQKILPMSDVESPQSFLVREGGRHLFTSFFLVVIVLETTDLILAVDSIAAVFGVTRDPFIVYSSNVCAILGLRALYFLLAGILQYFQYLDEGLAITVMFIGAKMLANPWVHISTALSLAIVGGIIVLSILVSIIRPKPQGSRRNVPQKKAQVVIRSIPAPTLEIIHYLADSDRAKRAETAWKIFHHTYTRTAWVFADWQKDEAFHALTVEEIFEQAGDKKAFYPRLTVGIAVLPETFERIRAANDFPPLADAPADQDVAEFELEFEGGVVSRARLDILTTTAPGGDGAIARYLRKFGEGVQQMEMYVTDVDRATEILRTQFKIKPIYPATRQGANGTRVNFFLVAAWNNQKMLVELVEQPQRLLG